MFLLLLFFFFLPVSSCKCVLYNQNSIILTYKHKCFFSIDFFYVRSNIFWSSEVMRQITQILSNKMNELI